MIRRSDMRRVFHLLLGFASALCAACSSQTSVAPSAGTSMTRVVSVNGSLDFGSVAVGSSASLLALVTSTGSAPVTISSLTLPPGFTTSWSAGTIPPDRSQVVTIRFTPTLAQRYDGQLTLNGDQTSGPQAVPVSGIGVASLVQITGIVTDGTSGGILPNVLVQITSGPDRGTSVRTDSSGAYSLVATPGSFAIQVSSTSYVTQTRDVSVASNTVIGFVLQRVSGPDPASAHTSLSFVSDPGDSVGRGQSRSIGLSDGSWLATFDATFGEAIRLTFRPAGGNFPWFLEMRAVRLSVGTTYEFNPNTSFTSLLFFFGDGGACSRVVGRFTINALQVSSRTVDFMPLIDFLDATFEQRCENASVGLRGHVTIADNPWR